jgi:eukaryotic-like serine/threonine-protein kinase
MTLAGTVLGGRYELDEQVGKGGYGEVWRATDTILFRAVAIKLLHPGYAQQPDALARFHTEARHAGALSHQNIARVYDYGESADGQSPYLVMELVDGPSLSERLARGSLDAARSMDIIAQAAAGLQAAHAAGLVHRDVKPANLLLDSGGTVKITDFGIANTIGSVPVTATGEVIGTPGYLAPERVAGERATAASDLYALGIVAYECLVGAPPFVGTPLEIALAHRIRPLPPLPPSVSPDLVGFVMHLTAKDPAWRPSTAAEVAVLARRLRDGQAGAANVQDSQPGFPPRAVVAGERGGLIGAGRRRSVLAAATMVLAGVTGLVLASSTGLSAGSHPVSVSSSTSSLPSPSPHSTGTIAAAQPTSDLGATPATSTRQQPVSNPASTPSSDVAAVAGKPGHKKGKGHGNGNGQGTEGNGAGNGNAQD